MDEKAIFKSFCKAAKYVEGFDKPYFVSINGKSFCSKDTSELYQKYLTEMKEMLGEKDS